LILARFVPVVRTFVTLVAGVGRMDFRRFITYTAIGGIAWACGVTILGHYLGRVDFIHRNIEAALILIVVVSLIPVGVELVLGRRRARRESAS
jgi:membrane-associated protein